MKELILSPNTLATAACLYRYRNYKILRRKADTPRSGADAGICIHAALAVYHRGGSIEEQEAAIDREREAHPLAYDDDYRTSGYLKEGFALLRTMLNEQKIEVVEVEKRGVRTLGEVAGTTIKMEFVRDLVFRFDGDLWIRDYKTASRNEQAEVNAFQNSGQFKCYAWAWNDEHPDDPVKGVDPKRLIMRKPSRNGTPFDVPVDPPVRFDPSIIEEWREMTLRRAADILRRDPADPLDWPMADHSSGLCRNQWGCCEYLPVCTLRPDNRALKLSTDSFVDSDYGKPKATE